MSIKQISVLVVEDNSTMRRIVRSLLNQLGFANVHEAIDGTDALKKLKDKPTNLIISDWNMAPMTGLELLKQVRATEEYKNIPFIMVTAESKPDNIIAAKQHGVSNYIIKPFSVDTLKSKLSSVLGQF